MLYNEFIEGTGCRDNEHNYKVYKDLEVMYMNSDMNKAEIYEYGKKLVDNSKSEKELEVERQVKAEIAEYKELIEWRKKDIERYQMYLNECINTIEEEKHFKAEIKRYRENIRHYRGRISALKWVLA